MVRDALHEAVGPGGDQRRRQRVRAPVPPNEWLRLLEALERPTSPRPAASAALTRFSGWERRASRDRRATTRWEEVHRRLHRWAALLRAAGVAALLENMTASRRLPARVLARPGGERQLTDLRHIGQLLHAAAIVERPRRDGARGVAAPADRRGATEDANDEDRSRRLESDAEAVQVLTIHRSKGLEFPVVYCPFLWDPATAPRTTCRCSTTPQRRSAHDRRRNRGRRRGLRPQPATLAREEQTGEDLRLALRRPDPGQAPGGRLVGRLVRAAAILRSAGCCSPGTPTASWRLGKRPLAGRRGGRTTFGATAVGISVERSPRSSPSAGRAPCRRPRASRPLVRPSSRPGLAAHLVHEHHPGQPRSAVGSEPDEEDVVTDEPVTDSPVPAAADGEALAGGSLAGGEALAGVESAGSASRLRAVPLLLADMPAGARVGTFVHRVLEATDFAAADLDAELARCARCRAVLAAPRPRRSRQQSSRGLRAPIETPLGSSAARSRLRDIDRRDRLDELDFELPLRRRRHAQTGTWRSPTSPNCCAPTCRRTIRWPGTPSGSPTRRLRPTLRGYLTGSLDLVFRLAGRAASRSSTTRPTGSGGPASR